MRLRCMVVVPDGTSRRVGPSGLVIGRQQDCDIVALDASVSRRHALVHVVGDAVEVVPLGRTPVAINGKTVEKPAALADGDELAVPGLVMKLKVELARPDAKAQASFALERGDNIFGIVHSPFVVGGGKTDDLVVAKWPPAALRLHVAQDELFAEGRAIDSDELVPIGPGYTIRFAGETFVVRVPTGSTVTTAVGAGTGLPHHVEVEMLPRGGRIVVRIGAAAASVYLADRRFDLLMVLLEAKGAIVSDDILRSKVWPKSSAVTRQEINTLISRCRRDLVEVGLAGPRLIERAPGGGGTRIQLAPDAQVIVR